MRIRIEEIEGLVFVEKPHGVTTHSTGKEQEDGLVEYLSRKLGYDLWVVHRLDKGTSGVQVFAKSKEDAANVSELFEQGVVNKRYLFVTRHKAPLGSFEVTSRIYKQGNSFISDKDSSSSNALTKFELIADLEGFYLWSAVPKTGKPHQIRLHAAQSGISILGDVDHGKDNFPRLMLHAAEISFPWRASVVSKMSEAPQAFINQALLNNPRCLGWISDIEWRQRFFHLESPNECLRLIQNRELGIRFDKLGKVLWLSDYTNQLSTERLSDHSLQGKRDDKSNKEGDRLIDPKEILFKLSNRCGESGSPLRLKLNSGVNLDREEICCSSSSYHIVSMQDRGDSQNLTPINQSTAPKTWVIEEGTLKLLLKSGHGFSSGIFIDQRDNREWVRRQSAGKSVLNLFSYAGAFSVAAALGGASSTVSVDTSNQAHSWARDNFSLNEIPLDNHKLITDDVRKILAKFKRAKRSFDLIICDPPSFARSKGSVFSLEKELEALIDECLSILNKDGSLLFSMNLEKISNAEFKKRITRCVLERFDPGLPHGAIEFVYPDWDAGLPREEGRLKTVKISK